MIITITKEEKRKLITSAYKRGLYAGLVTGLVIAGAVVILIITII